MSNPILQYRCEDDSSFYSNLDELLVGTGDGRRVLEYTSVCSLQPPVKSRRDSKDHNVCARRVSQRTGTLVQVTSVPVLYSYRTFIRTFLYCFTCIPSV